MEPVPDVRMEGHDRDRAVIPFECTAHGQTQHADLPLLDLNLDQDRRASSDKVQNFRKTRDRFVAALQPDLLELNPAQRSEGSGGVGQPVQFAVVKDKCLALTARLHVEFNAKAAVNGSSVFFIQKLTGASWWKSNSMPS